jgi:hypothetical protein
MNPCRSWLIGTAIAFVPQAGLAEVTPPPLTPAPGAAAPAPTAPPLPLPAPSDAAAADADIAIDPALTARLEALRAEYADLQQRATIATTSSPETPLTRQRIETLSADLEVHATLITLQQWRADTMAYFLSDISNRARGLPEPDWSNWTRSVVLAQVKEPTIAYSTPEAAAANRLADLIAGSPVLKLGGSPDNGWTLIWLPAQGFGYALSTAIVPVEDAE